LSIRKIKIERLTIVRTYSGVFAEIPVPAGRNSCFGSNHCRNDVFFDSGFSGSKKHLGFLFQNIDKKLSINPRHFLAQRRQDAKKTNFILKPLRLGVSGVILSLLKLRP